MKYPALTIVSIAAIAIALAACSKREAQTTTAAPPAATAFDSPEAAVTALVEAVEKNDVPALQKLLGPESDELLSSGDDVADKAEREAFVARYKEGHTLVSGGPNDIVLQVGADDWPLPIPLVKDSGGWRFDGAAGAIEVAHRRVGANELRTIDVMRGAADAQEEYAASGHDGQPAGIYAARLRSEPGKQNGLYWETTGDEPPSPAGPFLANAAQEGYTGTGTPPAELPYHGYLYRLLPSQGANASGGAMQYVVDGKQTGGFALLAYPAEYASSGVMTFMVNQDGIVWQRDLGGDTAKLAKDIATFDPDSSWTPIAPEADEDEEDSAS